MTARLLPGEFADLDRFVAEWRFETELERREKRLSSTLGELQEYYDTFMPRIEEIVNLLNHYALDDLPEDVRRLFDLARMLIEVAPCIEFYKDLSIPGAFPFERLRTHHVG